MLANSRAVVHGCDCSSSVGVLEYRSIVDDIICCCCWLTLLLLLRCIAVVGDGGFGRVWSDAMDWIGQFSELEVFHRME